MPAADRTPLACLLMLVLSRATFGADGDPVCPLTDKQQDDALSSFAQLAPIFGEPRCFNCHGGTSPFGQGRGKHPFAKDSIACKDGKPAEDGVRCPGSEEDVPATFKSCEECHSAIDGGTPPRWKLAPGDKQWTDRRTHLPKSTVQICEQQKSLFPNQADKFIAHMRDDQGDVQFLTAAFLGEYGLNKNGQSQIDEGVPLPDRPHMSRDDMFHNSVSWVEAMGNSFHDPDQCGCVRMHYALRVKFHGVFAPTLQSGGINFVFDTEDSDATPALIPLTFANSGNVGRVRGEGTLLGTSTGQVEATPGQCSAAGKQSIGVTVDGVWPALDQHPPGAVQTQENDSAKMELQLSARNLLNHGESTCTARGYVGSQTTNKAGPDVTVVNLSLDPVVGQSQIVPWNVPLPGWRGAVQVALVQVN
jgi:hypothetical protein